MCDAVADELGDVLLDVASDPDRVGQLYGMFREYCHAFRNDLHKMQLCLYMARQTKGRRGAPWDDVEGQYRRMERLVEQFQTICRPLTIRPIRSDLGGVIVEREAAWSAWMAAGGRRLELEPPIDPPVGCFDPARLTSGLDALAAWRAEAGEVGSTVHLGWSGDGRELRIDWREPGVTPPAPRDQSPDRPASLALPLIARVVSAHGGSLDVETRGDLRFVLRWPSEAPSDPEHLARPALA